MRTLIKKLVKLFLVNDKYYNAVENVFLFYSRLHDKHILILSEENDNHIDQCLKVTRKMICYWLTVKFFLW